MARHSGFAAGLLAAVLLCCLAGCTAVPPVQTTASASPESSAAESIPLPTAPSQTVQASVPEPSVTELPTTVPPITQPPTTAAPTTVPPTTQPPTTAAPTTVPPTTQPPTTAAPTTVPPTTQPPTTAPPATETPTEPEQPGGIPNRVTVEAPGILVESCESAVIDYSNTADGYVMVQFTQPTELRLKAQIKGPSLTYTYDLTPQKWTAFPLSDENGTYKITVYQNTSGSKYAAVVSLTVDVKMDNEFAPFLHSNQYVDFDAAPRSVAKAAQLTAGLTDPLQKVEKIYSFVVSSLTYDRELAATVTTGYLPELDAVLASRKGICFDYAALMTGMLRSQGVPTKLVVGYAGTAYHAWISVWSETDGWIDGAIYFDGVSWKRMDPTFASSGGSSMLEYIGDGTNYTPKYFY